MSTTSASPRDGIILDFSGRTLPLLSPGETFPSSFSSLQRTMGLSLSFLSESPVTAYEPWHCTKLAPIANFFSTIRPPFLPIVGPTLFSGILSVSLETLTPQIASSVRIPLLVSKPWYY